MVGVGRYVMADVDLLGVCRPVWERFRVTTDGPGVATVWELGVLSVQSGVCYF